jgi:hypothetical protein
MKAKRLSFSFIYFSESGLFKGLRAKKIKNSPRSQLASEVLRKSVREAPAGSRRPAKFGLGAPFVQRSFF